ncbi:MAG TPA: hypothetical protein DIT89_04590, partial [Planctomycetaceae bacterium]|nr:hypothetical protein [Planctomycetaceae bacterium]
MKRKVAGSGSGLAAALLLALSGCGQQVAEPPADGPSKTQAQAGPEAAPAVRRTTTEQQSKDLTEQVRQAIAHVDAAALSRLASDEAFADRVLQGTDLRGTERREAVEGLSGTLQEIFSGVTEGCRNGGSYSFVRLIER